MRWRMKDPHDNATFLAPKIRAYWDLCRPFTLLAPFIGGILFGAMALVATDGIRLTADTAFQIFYAAITLAALNAGSNAFNQATDSAIDAVNKPYRPIPSGMVSEGEAESIALLLWGAVLIRAAFVNWAFLTGVLVIMFFAWQYSDALTLKKRYVLNNLAIAIPRGFVGAWTAWSAIGDPWHPGILFIGATLMVYTFGATVFKDLPDVEGDMLHDVRNFVTDLGPTRAINLGVAFMLLSHGVVVAATVTGALPPLAHLFHINALLTIFIWWLAVNDADPDSAIENRWSWVLMYLQMMVMMIFFFVVFLYE